MNTYNVLNDFFTCLSLPTLVLNNSFKIVHSHKYNAELKNSFYTSKAIDILKNSLSYSNPIAKKRPRHGSAQMDGVFQGKPGGRPDRGI